ncbi:hypothetical protein CASFOL_041331 [Castilleja foliolosa]|uniref:Uncharacterized protein n=1 Tax=Castilleja foliolosa TaxID=1961234 RepID=A0ABD3BFU6_9LAMI
MVSVYPNPPPDRDFTHFQGFIGGDPMKNPGFNGGENSMLQNMSLGNMVPGVDDPNKKIRKPYTITKSRESWTDQEHEKFIEALQLFDRDWKKIEAFVGSKTAIQIRSHAQKYFLKVQKNGTSEHVPPPRPKRKAAHPYPQKAPKNAVSQATGPSQSAAALVERGYGEGCDSLSLSGNPISSVPVPLSSWKYNAVPTTAFSSHTPKEDVRLASFTNNYSSSSNETNPRVGKYNETHQVNIRNNTGRVTPDFAEVYRFIGSVFDPCVDDDHLQKLKKMDPIDVETVLLLMKNLTVNLMSPEFEDHRRLISSYNGVGVDQSEATRSKIQSV